MDRATGVVCVFLLAGGKAATAYEPCASESAANLSLNSVSKRVVGDGASDNGSSVDSREAACYFLERKALDGGPERLEPLLRTDEQVFGELPVGEDAIVDLYILPVPLRVCRYEPRHLELGNMNRPGFSGDSVTWVQPTWLEPPHSDRSGDRLRRRCGEGIPDRVA